MVTPSLVSLRLCLHGLCSLIGQLDVAEVGVYRSSVFEHDLHRIRLRVVAPIGDAAPLELSVVAEDIGGVEPRLHVDELLVAVDVVFVLTGFILGGKFGIGTIICAFLVGPVADFCMPFSESIVRSCVNKSTSD